jgi:hypothetical protein
MNTEPTCRSIEEVVQWTKGNGRSRLFLPPIQRSVVWRNSQIINYWDSLLRGYPAGLMMIHRPKADAHQSRSSDGITCGISADDFQLFDGQQRLTTILLGLGEGQLKDRLKLWVDLGCEQPSNSDLRFVLRINSTGQPFGYQSAAPNEKFPLYKRREKTVEWNNRSTPSNGFLSKNVFAEAAGSDLIDSNCAIPFGEIITLVQKSELESVIETLKDRYPLISVALAEAFVQALQRALKTSVVFQLIDPLVVEQEDEYIRFFGRLGQGGTALTNDELTYSIIKHHFPTVHDRMKEISEGSAGRMTSEVHLVLAALRVAKVTAPWDDSGNWQIWGRPYPAFISRLRELPNVMEEFQRLIPTSAGGGLKQLLESIRDRLVYDKQVNPCGLPVILLARLPHQLIDVLILMESQSISQEASPNFLSTFVLYWLLFVADSKKAADTIFKRFCLKEAGWNPISDNQLIRYFEEQGISRALPCQKLLGEAREQIVNGTHLLRAWSDRFTALDANKEKPLGDALRRLTTDQELIKRVLLWLQRDYLAEQFPSYDPTSSRDEDLPIDLDHLIPNSKFGANWRRQQKCLSFADEGGNFHYQRGTVGNSLGNFRWLDASDNRSRKANLIEDGAGERYLIKDVSRWNALIEKNPWTEEDVATFQQIIDLRSIAIYEALLVECGLNAFASLADTSLNSPED